MSNFNLTTALSTYPLSFEDTDIQVIDRNGRAWITAADLARALGYKEANAVTKIYNRRKDEFTPDMTALVTLQANEFNARPSLALTPLYGKTVRLFSARGCWSIAFISRAPKAKAFRTWVSDVLESLQDPRAPQPVAPIQKTYLPNADHLSLRDTMMHPDAFEKILNIAECMTGSHDVSDWERAINKRAGRMAAERLEEMQMDAMLGMRMLTESDHIGGFKTTVLPSNARLLLDNEIADYIRSASGPRMRMLPDIIHACTERLNELYELPLHGLTDDEG